MISVTPFFNLSEIAQNRPCRFALLEYEQNLDSLSTQLAKQAVIRRALPAFSFAFCLTNTPWGYIINIKTKKGRDRVNTPCACSQKKKERTEEEYKKLIHRLNRIEGQIRGIRGMVENDAYCTDILIQVSAVGAALNAFNRELLANHIRTCVTDDIRSGKDEAVDELLSTLQKLMK